MQLETSRVPLRFTAYGLTDVGLRVHNEDCVLVRHDLQLFILADGAGGHNAGNVASALATTSIANFFEGTHKSYVGKPDIDDFGLSLGARRLATAIQRAHHDIVGIAKTANKYHGMGTTVVAAFAAADTGIVHVGHVGDSRCYRMRGGQLEQLTHDHSLLNDVLELRPDIDEVTIAKLPRHVVTRALGMEETIRVSVRSFQMLPDDRYLLCSDGLTDALDDETIAIEMARMMAPDETARHLVEAAKFVGGADNIAVIVIACEAGADAPPMRRQLKSRPHFTPEMRGTMGSAPEIIVVGTDEIVMDGESTIHVVPAESASPSLLDAFAGLAGARRKKPPRG